MKNRNLWVISAALFLLFAASGIYAAYENARSVQASVAGETPKVVVIDAGHGGMDGGAVSVDGTCEKEINLALAQRLQSLLQCAGVETVMTRTTDDSIHDPQYTTVRKQKISDIHNRLKIMEETDDSVFVSIHQNFFTSARYYGTQTFYSDTDPRSRTLAQCIQDAVVSSVQPENKRAIKKSGTEIYLLYHAVRPAVMVECGFLSNPQEAALLKTPKYQTKMALAIMKGIFDFWEKVEGV
ncbi:MAG: N-acetylmuramoyl-L-alanine amidase [Clostridia bacterium]|nr:N-acetylmuramoyl-L-alanine amidase [Clostridia bacterium]